MHYSDIWMSNEDKFFAMSIFSISYSNLPLGNDHLLQVIVTEK